MFAWIRLFLETIYKIFVIKSYNLAVILTTLGYFFPKWRSFAQSGHTANERCAFFHKNVHAHARAPSHRTAVNNLCEAPMSTKTFFPLTEL
jgi:hypothetical protein